MSSWSTSASPRASARSSRSPRPGRSSGPPLHLARADRGPAGHRRPRRHLLPGRHLYNLVTGHTPYSGSSGPHIMSKPPARPLTRSRASSPPKLERGVVPRPAPDAGQGPRRAVSGRDRPRARPAGHPARRATDRGGEFGPGDNPPRSVPGRDRESATSGAGTSPPDWLAPDLGPIETALAAAIGPVASVLVRQSRREAPSRDHLVDALARHIPDPSARDAFVATCHARPTAAAVDTLTPTPTPTPTPYPNGITDETLQRMTAILAAHIGPVARILVRREARRSRDLADLVAVLSTSIPERSGRDAFRRVRPRSRLTPPTSSPSPGRTNAPRHRGAFMACPRRRIGPPSTACP